MDVDRRRRNIASSFVHMCLVHIHAFSPSPPFFFHSESTDEHVCAIFFFFFKTCTMRILICTYAPSLKRHNCFVAQTSKKKKREGKEVLHPPTHPPKKKELFLFLFLATALCKTVCFLAFSFHSFCACFTAYVNYNSSHDIKEVYTQMHTLCGCVLCVLST